MKRAQEIRADAARLHGRIDGLATLLAHDQAEWAFDDELHATVDGIADQLLEAVKTCDRLLVGPMPERVD